MRLLVVKESMHGSLLLQSAWVHVRMGSRVETPVLLSVHVHVEAEHLRLVHGAHAGLHGSRRASSVKAGAFIVGAHVQSWLVYVSLRRARVSAINLGTKLLQPKHTPLQSIPHDGCFARHRRAPSDRFSIQRNNCFSFQILHGCEGKRGRTVSKYARNRCPHLCFFDNRHNTCTFYARLSVKMSKVFWCAFLRSTKTLYELSGKQPVLFHYSCLLANVLERLSVTDPILER